MGYVVDFILFAGIAVVALKYAKFRRTTIEAIKTLDVVKMDRPVEDTRTFRDKLNDIKDAWF